MSGYGMGRLRRALSLRRPTAARAVELPDAAPDPKLGLPSAGALQAGAPLPLPDPKLAAENDDAQPPPGSCAAVPAEERWSFDNPPPWHRQFSVRCRAAAGRTNARWRSHRSRAPWCQAGSAHSLHIQRQGFLGADEQKGGLAGARDDSGRDHLRRPQLHHHQGARRAARARPAASSKGPRRLRPLRRSAAGADDGHHAVAVHGDVADRVRPAQGPHRAHDAARLEARAVHAAGMLPPAPALHSHVPPLCCRLLL
jgi:hypothetical protein